MKYCREIANIFEHFAAFHCHFRNLQPIREKAEIRL